MGVKMALPTEQPNRRTWGKETYYTSFHFSHVINLSRVSCKDKDRDSKLITAVKNNHTVILYVDMSYI